MCRRQAGLLLLEDPDHRLRASHLQLMLQAHLGSSVTPEFLQAALRDSEAAPYFSVDWIIPSAWHKRVVHLNTAQLEKLVKQTADGTAGGCCSVLHPARPCVGPENAL